jgi:metal-sulfur cluster biosynthetic enzyme
MHRQTNPKSDPNPPESETLRNIDRGGGTHHMLTKSDILLALRDCYDPVLPCNIVDLGLIRSITITPDHEAPGANIPGVPQKHKIQIEITPTQNDEAAIAQLQAQIINRLAGLETVSHTTVTVLHDPAWTPQAITAAGRKILGLDGHPHLVQIR